MNTDVSVVMPAFNASATIAQSIESALNQTAPPLEIIVVNDASTDDTGSIVAEMAKQHPSLRVIEMKQNCGLSAARNTAIREAKGSWIALLDSDDLWAEDKLSDQLAFAAGNPDVDMIGCFYREMFDSSIGAVRREFFWPSACLIKKSVALDVPFNPEWVASEFPEFLSRFDVMYKKDGVPKPLMFYRLNLTGIAHRSFLRERMAWKLASENARRRKNGSPEISYSELEDWYRRSFPWTTRLRKGISWRGDRLLRESLFHAKKGQLLRACLLGLAGTLLNPMSLATKWRRLASLGKETSPQSTLQTDQKTEAQKNIAA